ncbi:MAG: TIGR00266 family protein [Acidobacteriota bacterium]
MAKAHEIEYEIQGEEMQFVEILLDPGETVVSEAGSMMFMGPGIQMETRFGTAEGGGLMDKLFSAGKRILTGESLFLTTFTHRGSGKGKAAFAAPYPGKIIPLDLRALGPMLCQKDSYLCSALGVNVSIAFTKRFGAGLFGGEGFILQRLEGDGLAFVHAGGTILSMDLAPGEVLRVDTGCLVAFQPTVAYDIQFVGSVKSALFGGEGLFFAQMTGPGRVYLQSLPFSRLAGRIFAAAPQRGGRREEGSLLGGLGGILDGDNH